MRGARRAPPGLSDPRHDPRKRRVGQGIDEDARRLPGTDPHDIGFIHVGEDFHRREIGQREDHGAGIVHRPRHHVLPGLDVQGRHDSVHRREEYGLAEILLPLREAGLRAADLFLRGLDARRCLLGARSHGDHLGIGREPLRGELLDPGEAVQRLALPGLGERDLGLSRLDRGVVLGDHRSVAFVIEAEQKIALRDALSFLDR